MTYPIGIFDSGYGGLTVLKAIQSVLPDNDFLYLGDNARAPYGTKSFTEIYHNTRECVAHLFAQGCPLVILACNTASARALRTIQQQDLSDIQHYPHQRVLGVIRPTAEIIGDFSHTQAIGILGTPGTVKSSSYLIEIKKFYPKSSVVQQACPTWVDFIEQGQYNSPAAQRHIQKDVERLLAKHPTIDCILLACTHYPLVAHHIREYLPSSVKLLEQGDLVADKLVDYLKRHAEIEKHCGKQGKIQFFTTGNAEDFQQHAKWFYGKALKVNKIQPGLANERFKT
ncbi:MAG: glutamate racemase [Gammaproteobacteria bacterium]|nr:MAG: glutamate racemase [Gammaproteobacteria bacterium]